MNYIAKRDIIRGRNGDLASTINQLALFIKNIPNADAVCDVSFNYDGESGWSCAVYYDAEATGKRTNGEGVKLPR